MNTYITHCTLYTGDQVLFDQTLEIKGRHIHSFFSSDFRDSEPEDTDAGGMIVAPAFIDLQLYGAKGKLFNNTQDLETLRAIHAHNLTGGTTRFMVTLSTSSAETIFRAIDTVRQGLELGLPGLLGLHLEGPFINAEKRGAHLQEFVCSPNDELFKKIVDHGRGCVKMMTIAPEFFTSAQIRYLIDAGILLSAGHSNASYEQSITGFNQGISAVTHLYNAMSQFGSREPGLTGASLNYPGLHASIIADGIHCSFKSLEIASRLMQNRLFLITDSVTETNEGPYHFINADDRYLTTSGTLAGSALKMNKAVSNCIRFAGLSLENSLRMASANPAALINLQNLGIVRPGALADLVVLDHQINVRKLFYEGRDVTASE